jgi:hypothetical protein
VLADPQLGDGGEVGAVLVQAREVPQQVAHRGDAQAVQPLGHGRADALHFAHGLFERGGHSAASIPRAGTSGKWPDECRGTGVECRVKKQDTSAAALLASTLVTPLSLDRTEGVW